MLSRGEEVVEVAGDGGGGVETHRDGQAVDLGRGLRQDALLDLLGGLELALDAREVALGGDEPAGGDQAESGDEDDEAEGLAAPGPGQYAEGDQVLVDREQAEDRHPHP